MDHSTLTLIISLVVLAYSIGKDLFGGGGKLTSKFAELDTKFATFDKATTAAITAMRFEFIEKNERNNSNSQVGFEAIKSNIGELKLAFAEFRAKNAEEMNKYMLKESFYKATDDLKRDFNDKHNDLKADVHRGFEETRAQLDAMAQSIEAGRQSTRRT